MKSVYRTHLAECVGLWIAEGDDKTIREITFTNNCEPLVKLFYRTVSRLFPKGKFRIYVYSPNGKYNLKLEACYFRLYKDVRATRPYYILRYANTKDTEKWRKLVTKILTQKKYYPDILRGFFAGEGSVKTGSHSNRTIRISQKSQLKIIDDILRTLGISFSYSIKEESYLITGRWNWEKFYRYGIFNLHPGKKIKFIDAWKSYKEIHYPNNFIRNNILGKLTGPMTSRELATLFNRRQATLQEILSDFKRENKVINYRCRNKDYWVKTDSNILVISNRKSQILKIIKSPSTVSEIANELNIDWKAARRRLSEMERLGLVKEENYLWKQIPINKEVVVI